MIVLDKKPLSMAEVKAQIGDEEEKKEIKEEKKADG